MAERRTYEVTVEEVYSGDDLVLMVNLGVGGLYKKVRARLVGVDTPSAFQAARNTEAGRVRDLVRTSVGRGKCSIELHSEGKGGWLVTLFVNTNGNELNVNAMLVERGYVYTPQPGKQACNT